MSRVVPGRFRDDVEFRRASHPTLDQDRRGRDRQSAVAAAGLQFFPPLLSVSSMVPERRGAVRTPGPARRSADRSEQVFRKT